MFHAGRNSDGAVSASEILPTNQNLAQGGAQMSQSDTVLASPVVQDKENFAHWHAWRSYPFLKEHFNEDVTQVVELLVWQYPQEMTIREWRSVVGKALHALAKDLGVKRGRGEKSFTMKEVPFTFLAPKTGGFAGSDDSPDDSEGEFAVALQVEDWTDSDPWLEQAYEFCRSVILDPTEGIDEKKRREWMLFCAWLEGWSELEIEFSFGLSGEILREKLRSLAEEIRSAAKVETKAPLPYPSRRGDVEMSEDLAKAALTKVNDSKVRYLIPAGMSTEMVRVNFALSQQEAEVAKFLGWVSPGEYIPEQPFPDFLAFNLTNRSGKQLAIRHMLARDGWYVMFGALWCHCGICKQLMLVSNVTIDHIHPRSKGGGDNLGNLTPSHEICNQLKADETEGYVILPQVPFRLLQK